MADLFDGRLKKRGVREHHTKKSTATKKCLTDELNYLWVYANEGGLVSTFHRSAPNGTPERILSAISDVFDAEIVSEYEPQYWGFETEEEMEAAFDELARKRERNFYNEALKYVRGEDHNLMPERLRWLKPKSLKG